MSGLHCTGASSAEHIEAKFGKLFAQKYYLAIHGVGSQKGVPTHYSDAMQVIVNAEELAQTDNHPMVVEHTCDGLLDIAGQFTL